MPFTLAVTRTVNGSPHTDRVLINADEVRADVERTVEAFHARQLRMEHVLTLSAGGSGPEAPAWVRSTRWADVKDIWIEETS